MEMGFADTIKLCFQKYADFEGRAGRQEFWYFALFCLLVHVLLKMTGLISPGISHMLAVLFSLAVLVPSAAVGARRLHDVDKSGWLQLIVIVPLLGALALIYFWAQPGKEAARAG